MKRVVCLALACVAAALPLSLVGCSEKVASRGFITTSDGVVLARSVDPESAESVREYPEGTLAGQVVGSCYFEEGANGLEGVYAKSLEEGADIVLTIDSRIQEVAESALEGASGAIVVMNPHSGAVLAMASAPSVDPGEADSAAVFENKAVVSRIPGSTFKTITLCAALECGMVGIDDVMDAPAFIALEGGSVSNANSIQYGKLTVREAYERSVNTVFAQLSMGLGKERIAAMAEEFGFGANVVDDVACEASAIQNIANMSPLAEAWCGVGQALIQVDGSLEGPTTTVLHMAAITSCFVNGGVLYKPYLVQGVDEPVALNQEFLSDETISAVKSAMQGVVTSGTGVNAAVEGVCVGGKTGTAETAGGEDDGWFCGYALTEREEYVIVTLVEGAESAQAASMTSRVVREIVS